MELLGGVGFLPMDDDVGGCLATAGETGCIIRCAVTLVTDGLLCELDMLRGKLACCCCCRSKPLLVTFVTMATPGLASTLPSMVLSPLVTAPLLSTPILVKVKGLDVLTVDTIGDGVVVTMETDGLVETELTDNGAFVAVINPAAVVVYMLLTADADNGALLVVTKETDDLSPLFTMAARALAAEATIEACADVLRAVVEAVLALVVKIVADTILFPGCNTKFVLLAAPGLLMISFAFSIDSALGSSLGIVFRDVLLVVGGAEVLGTHVLVLPAIFSTLTAAVMGVTIFSLAANGTVVLVVVVVIDGVVSMETADILSSSLAMDSAFWMHKKSHFHTC